MGNDMNIENTHKKWFSKLKLNSLVRLMSILIVCITILHIAVITLDFPRNYAIGNFLINEEYLSPVRNEALKELKLRSVNVTIFGVGRDIGDILPKVLPQVTRLGEFFESYQILFVEGGSKDNTVQVFNEWMTRNKHIPVHFISSSSPSQLEGSGHFSQKDMPREGRLAAARNKGLETLRSHMAPTDYVIMIDMDILGWDMKSLLDSFFIHDLIYEKSSNLSSQTSTKGEWDVMCSNGIILHGLYRDTYAHRTSEWDTNHHWAGRDGSDYDLNEQELPLRRKRVQEAKTKVRESMSTNTWLGHVYKRPFQVLSCFGGLAIYRYKVIEGCNYDYRHPEPPYMLDCEHVLFHECLVKKNKARIFANPNMKLWYGHSPFKQPTTKLFKAIMDWWTSYGK